LIGFVKRMIVKIFVYGGLDFAAPADFCRVTAKLRPTSGSEITAEVWLPQHWNGKLLAMGGGGFNGGLGAAPLMLRTPLAKGYVAMVTDAGHEDTNSAKFAHDFPEQYTDYAYRANHVAAGFVKELTASYYSAPVKRSYFHGCSNGGRDALMEARRFPDDYDGIIAGAPAAGWTKLMTSFAWNTQAIQTAPKLKSKLKLVQDAVIAKCDKLDGVKDGLLENPTTCAFDPVELQCRGDDRADCLNADEVSALRKIYGGPRLRNGKPIYAGLSVGGEGLKHNWDDWLFSNKTSHAMFARESYRWMVYGDPDWDVSRFDIDRDYPKAKDRMGPMMDSDDPNLSAFVAHGGKLLLYHGWNDAAIPAAATVDYYAAVRRTLGVSADAQVRLFLVPGMMHCLGGVGPTDFDMLEQIDRWSETGAAPERIVATEYDPPAVFGHARDAKVVRTRPLCPWPKVAHYNGSGSSDNEASFSCQ
jgi:feruloyl esterase